MKRTATTTKEQAVEMKPVEVADAPEVHELQQPAQVPELRPADRVEMLPAIADHATMLINTIAAAASDPNVDVAKLEKLMDLQERVISRAAEMEFNRAMNRAQGQMRVIGKDAKNSQTNSRYATFGKLDMALRPIYTSEGFSLSFDTAGSALPDHMKVMCHVAHQAGHSRLYSIDIPTDGKGAKGNDVMTKTHATGAGVSYGCRYLLKLIWNVAVGEEDQDGNDVSGVRVAEWVAQAERAKDLHVLADVKDRGFAAIEKDGTMQDYQTFKRAVMARKTALENPAKATREPGAEG